MGIKLSLCIPTHNRAAFIGQAIESICSQANDEVEIVISDNASTDNTEEIVRKYQQQFPRITYFRWDRNMGADLNFLKVVDLSLGEYCWFLGSDDRIEPGGLAHVLWQMQRYPGLCGASVNQILYLPDMCNEVHGTPVAGGRLSEDRLFTDMENCFSLLGLYFGYLSGQIVNRYVWNNVVSKDNLEPYCNAFVHVYVIGQMLRLNPNWLYIHRKCVGYRSGNDSFLQEVGVYRRQIIAHEAFEKIVRALFEKNSRVYNNVLYMALSGYMTSDLVGFKVNGASILLQFKLFVLYTKLYWHFSAYWFKVFPLFLIPNPLVRVLRDIYRAIFKKTLRSTKPLAC